MICVCLISNLFSRLDDIVIGAPLYSDLTTKDGSYEKGRIYVAYQTKKVRKIKVFCTAQLFIYIYIQYQLKHFSALAFFLGISHVAEGDFDKHVQLFILVILPHSLYVCIFVFVQILLIIIGSNK